VETFVGSGEGTVAEGLVFSTVAHYDGYVSILANPTNKSISQMMEFNQLPSWAQFSHYSTLNYDGKGELSFDSHLIRPNGGFIKYESTGLASVPNGHVFHDGSGKIRAFVVVPAGAAMALFVDLRYTPPQIKNLWIGVWVVVALALAVVAHYQYKRRTNRGSVVRHGRWQEKLAGVFRHKHVDETGESRIIGSSTEEDSELLSKPVIEHEITKERMTMLQVLRAFAAIHVMFGHYYSSATSDRLLMGEMSTGYQALDNFLRWAMSQLTFFFVLSGFVMAVGHIAKQRAHESEHATKYEESVSRFLLKRALRLYPVYMASVLIVYVLHSFSNPFDEFVVVLLGLHCWLPEYLNNTLNTPGWAVGAFMMCYIVFIPSYRILCRTNTKAKIFLLLPLFWAMSAWQAAYVLGKRFTVFGPVFGIFFLAHVPSFLFGVTLGMLASVVKSNSFSKFHQSFRLFMFVGKYLGTSIVIASIGLLWCKLDLWTDNSPTYSEFVGIWAGNGLLCPMFGLLIWVIVFGSDPLCLIRKVRVLCVLGDLSFAMYAMQVAALTICNQYGLCNSDFHRSPVTAADSNPQSANVHFLSSNDPELTSDRATFIDCAYPWGPVDVILAFACARLIGAPVAKLASFSSFSEFATCLRQKLWPATSVLLYYLAFSTICGLYIHWSLVHDHSYLVSVSRIHWLNDILQNIKWLSVIPLPILIIQTIGHIRFPPVLSVKYPPISDMIESEPISSNSSLHSDEGSSLNTSHPTPASSIVASHSTNSLSTHFSVGQTVDHVKEKDAEFQIPSRPVSPIHANNRFVDSAKIKQDCESPKLMCNLYFRIVTRGCNPKLVARNACKIGQILSDSLPPHLWVLEVVTDNAIGLRAAVPFPVSEIVVPTSYRPPNGALYKARALHFAIQVCFLSFFCREHRIETNRIETDIDLLLLLLLL
jgi:peptidoglycan/LPS O-acetylase OafA/YrhL